MSTDARPPASMTDQRFPDRRPAPRRVRSGLKLRSRDPVAPSQGHAGLWIQLIERQIAPAALQEGLEYARSGQIVALEVRPGGVAGRVQGRANRPYETRLGIEPFSDEQWESLVASMAGEAMYVVKLLAGELPENLDALLAAMDLSLAPEAPQLVHITCTCAEPAPCKHAAAMAYVLAEQLAEQPLLALTLRGMPAESLLERLRQARTINARGVMAAHADPMIPASQVEPPPLDECLHNYWRCGPELSRLQALPPAQHAPHALLRRLGPSPLKGRFPFVGLLASVYDSVAVFAVRVRDQAERVE